MLQSEIFIEKAKQENHEYYQNLCKFRNMEAEEKSRHEKRMKFLRQNYNVAVAMEKNELRLLKAKFDIQFPQICMDYYSEREIVDAFSRQDFEFLREMKALELCGDFAGVCYYSPTWR